jgi:hypothetical protein
MPCPAGGPGRPPRRPGLFAHGAHDVARGGHLPERRGIAWVDPSRSTTWAVASPLSGTGRRRDQVQPVGNDVGGSHDELFGVGAEVAVEGASTTAAAHPAVAGRLVHTARRRILHMDPAWPWADAITTAHARLRALRAP